MNRSIVLRLASFGIAVAITMCPPSAVRGDDVRPKGEWRRWAVVASPDVARYGLPDLMTVALSEDSSLELVEREELAAAMRELELAAYLGPDAGRQRLQLGQVLKADALVLLSLESPPAEAADDDASEFLKLIIAECRSGTRLTIDYLPYDRQKLDELAKQCAREVNDTRRRFTKGIERTIGVTQFLSKNFAHDYDHLQSGYAGLLANALTAFPGVAVIEIEEARAIAAELERSGDDLAERVVPLIVTGQFEVSKPESVDGKPTIDLVVELSRGGNTVGRGVLDDRPLADVPGLLRDKLARTIIQRSSTSDGPSFSIDEQYALLVARADTFARVGGFEQSTALREAALLLKPNELEQKLTLISEYLRGLRARSRETWSQLVAERNDTTARPADAKYWDTAHDGHMKILRVLAHHIEEVIHRRQVNAREADQLVSGFREVLSGTNNVRYGAANVAKGRNLLETFAWRVFPLLSQLDPDLRGGAVHPALRDRTVSLDKTWTAEQQRDRWTSTSLSLLMFTLPTLRGGGGLPSDHQPTLGDLERFLTEVPTGSLPIRRMAHKTMRFEIKGTAEQVSRFYERLKQSKNPWNGFYARCGQLARAVVGQPQSDIGRPLKDELDDLRSFVEQRAPGEDAELVRGTYLAEFDRLEQLIERRAGTHVAASPHPKPGPSPFVELPSRIEFEKIEKRGCHWESIQRCTDELDLCWWKYEVALAPEPGQTVTLHRAQTPEEHVASAHWDGRFVWVVTMASGVRVYDTSARQVIYFQRPQTTGDETENRQPDRSSQDQTAVGHAGSVRDNAGIARVDLPPYERIGKLQKTTSPPLRLHPVGAGRAIMMGRYGKLNRLWFAHAQVGDSSEGKAASIDVFHTCTKVRSDPDAPDDDPEQIFLACWMAELQEPESGRRQLIVGRMQEHGDRRIGRQPLVVDLETLKASVFPSRFPSMNFLPRYSFDGKILHMERSSVHVFTPNADGSVDWHHTSAATAYDLTSRPGQFVIDHAGFLYITGTQWLRIDRATWKVEKLTTDPLPKWMQFKRYGLSAHHGLVAWDSGKPLHRVTIAE
ncbi:MAG: hypothetical protein H8E44_22235 [Planctomycetes bacterium]|nr:hypothetical protein [Planctomycetota bacterium]MBL7044487.1 hypothetical protein [Pirellulaceae bacterium]